MVTSNNLKRFTQILSSSSNPFYNNEINVYLYVFEFHSSSSLWIFLNSAINRKPLSPFFCRKAKHFTTCSLSCVFLHFFGMKNTLRNFNYFTPISTISWKPSLFKGSITNPFLIRFISAFLTVSSTPKSWNMKRGGLQHFFFENCRFFTILIEHLNKKCCNKNTNIKRPKRISTFFRIDRFINPHSTRI